MYLCLRICASYSKGINVNVYVILCPHICTSEWVLCDCENCEHIHMPPVRIRMYVCLCVHVRSGVCAGDSLPSTLTPAKPREGAAAVAAAAAGRPSSPAAPPPPQPLPAGRFADRPNRQKLRARGQLGAFLLWCELPMAGARAGAGTQAQPNQPGCRARSPGRQAETRGRPPQTPPAPARPRPRALRPMVGPGAGQTERRDLTSAP